MHPLWTEALNTLRSHLSEESYNTWIAPLCFAGVDASGQLTLKVPNRFYADWVNAHYAAIILEVFAAGVPEPAKLHCKWEVDEGLQAQLQAQVERERQTDARDASRSGAAEREMTRPALERKATATAGRASAVSAVAPATTSAQLNPKYRFDTFIVGPSNQLAHAASVAVGASPGRRYNPLFMYGGVGLGKTHLCNAIGHQIRADRPAARIVYVSAEEFTNEFIWALRNHRIDAFRARYRSACDVLLMDDIQFLAGREQTQEEFFHTFNALYHADRQIVVTSDVFPQQIPEMQERLVSRFQSGLVADTQPPELDTRVAILQKKAEQEGIDLDAAVAHYVAQVVKSNVRELEGTLLRLAVKAELLKQPLSLELARATVAPQQSAPMRRGSVDEIQRVVCEHYGLRISDLKSKGRQRSVALPRMVAMYLCRQRLQLSYPEIGDRFGGKDHTTVINAVRKVTRLVNDDVDMNAVLDRLNLSLNRSA